MKKLILIVAILALFAGSAQAINFPYDLPAVHNNVVQADSITFYSGVDNTVDTSAIYDISYAGTLGFWSKWAGVHATDSANFKITFQVSMTGDTAYYSWRTVGASVYPQTAAADSALAKVKSYFFPSDSSEISLTYTCALKKALGAKYIRWFTQQINENSTNDDSCWIANKLFIKE
jgi:hypothetical protein